MPRKISAIAGITAFIVSVGVFCSYLSLAYTWPLDRCDTPDLPQGLTLGMNMCQAQAINNQKQGFPVPLHKARLVPVDATDSGAGLKQRALSQEQQSANKVAFVKNSIFYSALAALLGCIGFKTITKVQSRRAHTRH